MASIESSLAVLLLQSTVLLAVQLGDRLQNVHHGPNHLRCTVGTAAVKVLEH